MYRIILINGRARVGKDTLASFLCNEFMNRGYLNTIVRGNAQTVKDYAKKYFQWNGVKDEVGRKLLINITNMMYDVNPVFWEERTLERFYNFANTFTPKKEDVIMIIPDWRYVNTYEFFNRVAEQDPRFKIYTIHLDRKDFNNNLSQELQNDISENNGLKRLAQIRIEKETSDLSVFYEIAEKVVDKILSV